MANLGVTVLVVAVYTTTVMLVVPANAVSLLSSYLASERVNGKYQMTATESALFPFVCLWLLIQGIMRSDVGACRRFLVS